MVQEATTGVETVVEPTVPEVPQETVETAEVAATPVETEGAEPPAEGEPVTSLPQSIEELIGDDDNLKSAYELRVSEVREEGRRQAQSEIQPRVDKANQTFQGYYQEAKRGADGVMQIRDLLQKALKSGVTTQEDLEASFKAAPEAWKAINDLTGNAGFYNGQRWAAAQLGNEIGGEVGAKFSGEYGTRLYNAEAGADDVTEVFKDMVKAYVEAQLDKATTPLKNRVKSLEAQIEKAKAQSGATGGPSPSAGKGISAGSKPYSQKTPEERAAMTPEERDAAIRAEAG